MEPVWVLLLVLLAGGWFVLEGFGLGAALVAARVAPGLVPRRRLLTAYGPFLPANEMWLIATAGLLAGAFGTLEGRLLSGLYAVFVPLLAAWVLRDAALWLRGRRPGPVWRRVWDRTLVASSAVFAGCVGVVLGNLAQGVPASGMASPVRVYGPFPLLCGATMAALFALHGAAFLRIRLAPTGTPSGGPAAGYGPAAANEGPEAAGDGPVAIGDAAGRAAGVVRRLAPVTAGLGLVTVVVAVFAAPSPYLLLALASPAAALAARTQVGAHPGRAFTCTAIATAAPFLSLAAATAGHLMSAVDAAPLAWALLPPAMAVVLLHQLWLWWLFRHPVTGRTAAFF